MIWLVGCNGMLGACLQQMLKQQDIDAVCTGSELDITKLKGLESFVEDKKITIIINAAAYTNVEQAEEASETAYLINHKGSENLALIAKKCGAVLIHISTDYVFNGQKEFYYETDSTQPLNVYGASKLAGEQAIQAQLDNYYILRVSWLFGYFGKNFVSSMLRLFGEKQNLSVVDDQYGCPTFTDDLARFILQLIRKEQNSHNIQSNSKAYGTYHLCNQGKTTWYGFAKEIFKQATEKHKAVFSVDLKPCDSLAFPTKATRPKHSVLDTTKLQHKFQYQLPTWQDALSRYLNQVYS